ncbi:fumarylacetoacetate hydrolase family protein [Clostridium grantii]|uniref:2-keto-4-pentenoate hydratase/2-oxohepta-3-ene-1,7-dioic acid hydratase (Catechol pathway) n=1 Tax=Clostridium grantii DSM 8605 TaxID=1121316 RepID=A0A1M5RM90_9CLOT|nr:fumarylacetoacetate hydrolase family protein [Clostridium grantii]SHH27447.1 2-keto-4-pentenoate hydratase/2-oxohepta-3-ene-1,7-dioic acid hydratase (catechol pathway) [Clostridium grantii DSM 8605]
MKYLRFNYEGNEDLGILINEETVIPFKKIFKENCPKNFTEFIENFHNKYESIITELKDEVKGIPLKNVDLKAPLKEIPRGVICLGKNYKEHVKEVPSTMDLKNGIPEFPIYFFKLVNEPVGPNEVISLHQELTSQLDYEVELGIIIGKEGKDIPPEKAEEYIFGYTIINDVSARNLQTKHVQWFRGKGLNNTCPIGPYLVDKSDIKFPVQLNIQSYVNGELRQNSNTKELIFDINYIISDLSKGTTLKPGDIIATGTPSGVGMGFKPNKFLKAGDVVKCVIEGIGEMSNMVK